MTMTPPCGDFTMPTAELPAPPAQSRDPVAPGKNRGTVVVVLCPACHSHYVGRRSSRVGAPFAWYRCMEEGCGYMWKEPFLLGLGAHRAVVVP